MIHSKIQCVSMYIIAWYLYFENLYGLVWIFIFTQKKNEKLSSQVWLIFQNIIKVYSLEIDIIMLMVVAVMIDYQKTIQFNYLVIMLLFGGGEDEKRK